MASVPKRYQVVIIAYNHNSIFAFHFGAADPLSILPYNLGVVP